ncbi:phage/plasmid primase, P4 family [Paracoccus sp. (in: a-proteobacteria)]|uniref:DNA primase family protein n=1 Tax=Paracoccus sp. TaxID=267 RepID=UPI002AFDD333|nr:phage/plasmid primase, P4 family [Paracoccus sp. (in: a-proteobacteria)]
MDFQGTATQDNLAAIVSAVQAALAPQPPADTGAPAGEARAEAAMPQGGADASADTVRAYREDDEGIEGSDGPSDGLPPDADLPTVERCAALDHSDTDNAERFKAHFGQDLVVLETEGVINQDYFVWCGTHWDMAGGNDSALRLAKKVGGLIGLEADYLKPTPAEKRAMEDGAAAEAPLKRLQERKSEWSDAEKVRAAALGEQVEAGKVARDALDRRKTARRKFGVSSKNKARVVALRDLAACDLTRKPSAFNADPRVVACATHTLRFVSERDLECPDPDSERYTVRCEAIEGHRREDLITKLIPVAYDKAAVCPRWDAFMARFLPVEAVRKCVQVGAGLALLGLPVQKLFFHYGNGANGKSVFLETLVRVLGAHAASLPTEAITGTGEKNAGAASPELARLYGVRFVRVLELPANVPLKEDIVKKLTGGEAIPVRNLFKGYFEFQPVFIGHMSGNGYPRIDGTDNGIWRRMAVIHWPVTLEEHEQRNFEDVVGDLVPEAPGILQWLIAGALTYLREGLIIPAEVKAATQEYRDEMDVVGQFVAACVVPEQGQDVTARAAYQSYVLWAEANGKRPVSETKFGRDIKKRLEHGPDSRNIMTYRNIRLINIPLAEPEPRSPHFGR